VSWGFGPYGITPWGGPFTAAPPPVYLQLQSAEAIRENVVRLTFDNPIYFSRWHDPADGSFVNRYSISHDPAAIGIDGEPTRPVNVADVQRVRDAANQVDVWTDRAFSPTGSRYIVTVMGLRSANMVLRIDPAGASASFEGVQQGAPRRTIDGVVGNRDFANPQMPGPGILANSLGHFIPDDRGDYAIDQGLTSYKKRVFRRLTTIKGTFRHIPGYGVGVPSAAKKLARANLTGSIAADAEDQIRQEPETISAEVILVPAVEDPSLFYYRINARTTLGTVSDYDVPVPTR
jgi:hypothetical protein